MAHAAQNVLTDFPKATMQSMDAFVPIHDASTRSGVHRERRLFPPLR